MRVSSKGQVTTPKAIRNELGLLPRTQARRSRKLTTDEVMSLMRGARS